MPYGEQFEATRQSALHSGQCGIPPERVAEMIIRALNTANSRVRYLVGRDAQLAARIAMLPARLKDRLLRAASKARPLKSVPIKRQRLTNNR